MEIALKQRAELKRLADRSGKAWSDIKRAAHSFNITTTTFLQMQELVAFTTEAAAIMETLRPAQPDDSRQVLLPLDSIGLVAGKVVITPNGSEPEQEVDNND